MSHCIIKVNDWNGKKVEGMVITEGSTISENELKDIVEEAKFFLSTCQNSTQVSIYCNCTIEVDIGGKKVIPETTVKVPAITEPQLRRLLFHIQNLYDQEDMDNKYSYFKGEVYEVVNHI